MKRSIAAIVLLALSAALSGCAGISQAVDAYGTVAVSDTKAANDTLIAAQKMALCATPVSALVRHPELVPAVRALCMPRGDGGTVDQVLDTIAGTIPAPRAPPPPVPK